MSLPIAERERVRAIWECVVDDDDEKLGFVQARMLASQMGERDVEPGELRFFCALLSLAVPEDDEEPFVGFDSFLLWYEHRGWISAQFQQTTWDKPNENTVTEVRFDSGFVFVLRKWSDARGSFPCVL